MIIYEKLHDIYRTYSEEYEAMLDEIRSKHGKEENG